MISPYFVNACGGLGCVCRRRVMGERIRTLRVKEGQGNVGSQPGRGLGSVIRTIDVGIGSHSVAVPEGLVAPPGGGS